MKLLWERREMIGAGGQADVYKASLLPEHPLFRSNPSLVLAVKSAIYTETSSICNEERFLKEFIDCPHIIRMFNSDITIEEDKKLHMNILMEYATGGNLHDMIHNSNIGGGISEIDAREYTESILNGLKYIHSRGYVHCDVKPKNILIVNEMANVAHFGVTMKAGKYPGKMVGTSNYMAPESIRFGEYETAADIWALGCCFFEMLTGEIIDWRQKTQYEFDRIVEQSRISNEAKCFLSRCLNQDPQQRWDADMLLLHRFIILVGHENLSDYDYFYFYPLKIKI